MAPTVSRFGLRSREMLIALNVDGGGRAPARSRNQLYLSLFRMIPFRKSCRAMTWFIFLFPYASLKFPLY